MKRISLVVAATALALGGALVGAVSASAHPVAHATPVLTVTPNTDLANGQTVQLSGTGFPPSSTTLVALECNKNGTTVIDCDINNLSPVTVDASGNLTGTFTVKTGTIGSTTCGTSAADASNCAVIIGDSSTYTLEANAVITFASGSTGTTTTTTQPTTTTTQPTTGPRRLKVAPSTNLRNGQSVKISGSGFKAGDQLYAVECVVGAKGQSGCNMATLKAVKANASGAFGPVAFKVRTGKVGNGVCGTTKANKKHCTISIANASKGDSAVVKIAFK